MQYKIYFEIFNKKMKCTITADDEKSAEYLLRGKIKIHKIEAENKFKDYDLPEGWADMFGGFKKP